MPASSNKVAIIFNDLTEFFATRDNLDALLKANIPTDIYVVPNYSKDMERDTREALIDLGYSVKDGKESNVNYKIILEPYPSRFSAEMKCDYRIKYTYGANSAKPDPVFSPSWNLSYDASIQYSRRDAEIRSVYSRAYVIPYAKYKGFTKNAHNEAKPRLLYLPTFGNVGSISSLTEEVVADIKQQYTLVVKAHHAIQFREDERDNYELLQNIADEFHDSSVSLEGLLADVDVVLSDNSGAIFEAIYAEVPVAVFSDRLNDRKLGGLNTLQHDIVAQGVVPCAKAAIDILSMLQKAMKLQGKQREMKQQLFVSYDDKDADDFVSVIKTYLSKNRDEDYYTQSRDILRNDINDKNRRISALSERVQELEAKVGDYENSSSWKITEPLRKVNAFTKRRKNG